jgi:cyclopropane fatty-acyl-phospholipid synthase-like methyltransferase
MEAKKNQKFFEPQYQLLEDEIGSSGRAQFGLMSSYTWNTDPKRLLFVLARYKFAAKVLAGRRNVLEVGCGDGFASRLVRQHVENLTITDADEVLIRDAVAIQSTKYPVRCAVHNFSTAPWGGGDSFDGVYLLDVLEHVNRSDEVVFLRNIERSMGADGTIVVGMPSIESQQYASAGSLAGHVNCKTQEELRAVMESVFPVVFMFSMNDEVVHTGFSRMANYVFAVGVKGRCSLDGQDG